MRSPMKRSRQRLTIRILMISVAAFALSLKLGLAYSRSSAYWRESRFHARAGQRALYYAGLVESGAAHLESDTPEARHRAAEQSRKLAAHWAKMQAKYVRAALLPWLPDAPEVPQQ
jgi:hypothetical protein